MIFGQSPVGLNEIRREYGWVDSSPLLLVAGSLNDQGRVPNKGWVVRRTPGVNQVNRLSHAVWGELTVSTNGLAPDQRDYALIFAKLWIGTGSKQPTAAVRDDVADTSGPPNLGQGG